jgi:hypothetical protein
VCSFFDSEVIMKVNQHEITRFLDNFLCNALLLTGLKIILGDFLLIV